MERLAVVGFCAAAVAAKKTTTPTRVAAVACVFMTFTSRFATEINAASGAGTSARRPSRCYGANISDAYHIAGTYVGRILKGEKPTDLPVQRSTFINMILNLKTAKALGIEVPTATLLRATEVIE
jgi:hypothetical protein